MTDVPTLIESIRSTRDKLAEEIRPQEEAIAATRAEIARLNAMLSAYEGTTEVPKAESPKRRRKAQSSNGTSTLALFEQYGESVVAEVRKNPGRLAEEIRKAVGYEGDSSRFSTAVFKPLRDSGRIRTEGKTRQMTYFPA